MKKYDTGESLFPNTQIVGGTGKELIPISEHNGKKAVNARYLHAFLESKREFSTWIKDRIQKYDFVENQDYVSFDEIVKREKGATVLTEYALSISCAKEIAMVEGNTKGKQARQYFIECEQRLKENSKPLSQIEIIAQSAQVLLEHEKRLNNMENRVSILVQRQIEAENELKALPVSSENVPEMSLKDKIRLLVNRYCAAAGLVQKSVWDSIYQTLYYNYHIAIRSCNKLTKNESWLEVAERNGHLDKIYIIISDLLRIKGLTI